MNRNNPLLKIFFFFAVLLISYVPAQSTSNKWTFGGAMGLHSSWSRDQAIGINVSPRAGFKITEQLEVGMSARVDWLNSSYASSTLFGIGPFVNYYFNRKFFFSGLFQEVVINEKIKSTSSRVGFDEAALYFGGGYMQTLGPKTYLQIGLLYNVIRKENSSVFNSSFFPNVGIVYGL